MFQRNILRVHLEFDAETEFGFKQKTLDHSCSPSTCQELFDIIKDMEPKDLVEFKKFELTLAGSLNGREIDKTFTSFNDFNDYLNQENPLQNSLGLGL